MADGSDDRLVRRAVAAVSNKDPADFGQERLWRIYTGLFGCAVSLIAARSLVEERSIDRLGGFDGKHAVALQEDLFVLTQGMSPPYVFDWFASEAITIYSAGYFLNNAVQRIALATDRVVGVLEEAHRSTRERAISRRLGKAVDEVDSAKLRERLVGLRDAFEDVSPAKVRDQIASWLESLPGDATLLELDRLISDSHARSVAYCWARSNTWKHRTRGTTERLRKRPGDASGNASALEWIWCLRALEEVASLWTTVAAYVRTHPRSDRV